VTRDDFLRALRSAADPDPARTLDALVACSGAERGFLVLRRDGELEVRTARAMDGDEVRRAREKVSRTLLERALSSGRPVVASDAEMDSVGSLQGQKVRSVCVLPLRACQGAVYLDHRFERGLFADPDFLDEVAAALDRALRSALERAAAPGLVGRSKPMQALLRAVDRVAASPYPALLIGESGTGKELVAREIHRRSPRAGGPLVAANCAVLPATLLESELFGHVKGAFTGADRDHPGLFEQARGGTLFLDEVACLTPAAQESLLRVLETREVKRLGATKAETVDVRVVAATHEELETSPRFRRDLYYRLNVLRLDLPPLRDRKDDLPALAAHLLDRIARETGAPRKRLSPSALDRLGGHRWPGNVRELENALRRAATFADATTLEPGDFEFLRERPPAGPADESIVSVEDHIRATLLRWSGTMDVQEIADRLGVSRKTLWEKKKKWGP
jgi:DNA-binding NtrC family response regulator